MLIEHRMNTNKILRRKKIENQQSTEVETFKLSNKYRGIDKSQKKKKNTNYHHNSYYIFALGNLAKRYCPMAQPSERYYIMRIKLHVFSNKKVEI